jgi:hypothetical protein
MNRKPAHLNRESGSVIIMVIMILALLTIIGLSVSRNSSVEVMIANNAIYHQRTFFAAESGIVHAFNDLKEPFAQANANRALAQVTLDWDFALDGSYTNAPEDPEDKDRPGYDLDKDGQPDGAIWIDRAEIGPSGYSVSLWNNQDAGDYRDDQDAFIWMQADAIDTMGARSSIRVLLQGNTFEEVPFGYQAQEGAGSGKNFNASDRYAIGTFTQQFRGD